MLHAAAIGLGANLPSHAGVPAQTLRAAVGGLDRVAGVTVQAVSSIHTTAPVGPPGQPEYANAAATLETLLEPRELLARLLEVEASFGRNRAAEERWGPRTLDLDLLLFADRVIDEPGLTVPHPRLHERSFVLLPLVEVAADWDVPGFGATVAILASKLPAQEKTRAVGPG